MSERDKLSPEVQAFSDDLYKHSKVDVKTKTMTTPEDWWIKTLPEGCTVEQYRVIQKHIGNSGAALLDALQRHAVEHAKKHSELDSLSVEMTTVDKDYLHANWDYSTQVPNRLANGQTDGTKEKLGATQLKMVNQATKNVSQVAIVKRMSSENATEHLKSRTPVKI